MPEISIIVPVYNVEKYLHKCLDSIINQTFVDFEVILINDGSTDGSKKILENYLKKDCRFKLIEQYNQGLSSARNADLKVVKGKYISFLDSDDYWHPDFLKILYEGIMKTGSDVVGCAFKCICDDGKPSFYIDSIQWQTFSQPLSILLAPNNPIAFSVWNKLYRSDIVLNKFSFVEGIYFEDWVFTTCLFSEIKSFSFIDQTLYFYQESGPSIMRSRFTKEKIDSYKKGVEEVFKFFMKKKNKSLWNIVKRTRISRTIQMMLDQEQKDWILYQDLSLRQYFKSVLIYFCEKGLITYRGLSWRHRIRLFDRMHSLNSYEYLKKMFRK